MFGFSWSEILIIGVVALVLIGPNDLPRAMKTGARWMAAGRKLAREFQGHVDDLVREAELDDLREQARKLATQPLSTHIQNHIEKTIDPHRELANALSPPVELSHSALMTPTVPKPAVVDTPLIEAPAPEPQQAAETAGLDHPQAIPDPSAPAPAPPA
jgi:sec-independent protein translocase protein TatB